MTTKTKEELLRANIEANEQDAVDEFNCFHGVETYSYIPVDLSDPADAGRKLVHIIDALGMCSKLTADEVLRKAGQYTKNRIQGFCTSVLMGQFRVINIVFAAQKGTEVKLTNKNGNVKDVFAYVYNVDAPDLSELGYIFFEQRKNGTYHRIA